MRWTKVAGYSAVAPKFLLLALKQGAVAMYRPVRRHVDIKAQTLFTVIVPIPKRWVVRRHTTKNEKNN